MYEGHYATREDIDAAMRFGCGYPMGPLALLDLIGLDTAYEILDTMYKQGRDRLHAPAPILKQMVTAGPARPQVRPRLLHLRGARQPGRGRRRADPLGRRQARSCSHDISSVGVVGTGTMATGIVEVFAKAGYDVLYVGRSQDKVDGVRADHRADPRQAIQRGKLPRSDKAEVLGRLTGHDLARRPRRRRHRGRGDRRGPRRSRRRCSRTSTRSASRARSWPPPPPRCRSSRWPG